MIGKTKIFTLIILTIFLCSSCDMLRRVPFDVMQWEPGGGYFENTDSAQIALYFTTEPNKSNTEKAFSFTEDGNNITGSFLWGDNSFVFKPAAPLQKNKKYMISLTNTADDINGVSLENNFEGHFSTIPYDERPFVESVFPLDNSVVFDIYQKVLIQFSDAVTKKSCENHISFSPSIGGSWQISDDGMNAEYFPKEQWKQNQTYKITLSSNFENVYGRQLGKEFVQSWTIGDDSIEPVLLHAYIIDNAGTSKYTLQQFAVSGSYADTIINNIAISEQANVESHDKIKLIFSKPVDVIKLKTYLQVEPAIKYKIETAENFANDIVVSFDDVPEWGRSYVIKLNSGLNDSLGNISKNSYFFRIKTNGSLSKLPKFTGLRFQESFIKENADGAKKIVYNSNELFSNILIDHENYQYGTSKTLVFELFFDTALNAKINLFSLMNLFRVDYTNTFFSITAKSFKEKEIGTFIPPEGFENMYCVEVTSSVFNSENSGVIKFYIAGGLTDTNGNKNNDAMSIQVTK
ncbi:MAG: hypothetical protein Ta2F_04260 [Termitinemataceae bacterium]|nr:MAG: hypothetical protein Ta2F_04260 [Termitinemataceae bacterium]